MWKNVQLHKFSPTLQIQPLEELKGETRLSTHGDAKNAALVAAVLRVKQTVEKESGDGVYDTLSMIMTKKETALKKIFSQSRDIQSKLEEGRIVVAENDKAQVVGYGELDRVSADEHDVAMLKLMIPEANKKTNLGASIINVADSWADGMGCTSIRLEMEKRRVSDQWTVAFFVGAAHQASLL